MTGEAAPVTLTRRAADAVRARAEDSGLDGHLLRIAVVAGGCEGLCYELYFVPSAEVSDRVVETAGVRLAVDPTSLRLLEGVVIDLGSGRSPTFLFHNPRARASCSCGASFGV